MKKGFNNIKEKGNKLNHLNIINNYYEYQEQKNEENKGKQINKWLFF